MTFYSYDYYDLTNIGWVSFYDFFGRIGLYEKKDQENLDKYISYLNSGVWLSSYNKDYAIVGRRPKIIHRDANGRLHSEDEQAISWRDGFSIYFLHGVEFDKGLWKKVVDKKLDFKEIMALKNIEQRMVALKLMNPDEMLKGTGAELLNKSERGNELHLIKGLFSTDAYFLRYSCPSTGRVYIKGIPPEIGEKKDADGAQAWSHHLSKEAYELLKVES